MLQVMHEHNFTRIYKKVASDIPRSQYYNTTSSRKYSPLKLKSVVYMFLANNWKKRKPLQWLGLTEYLHKYAQNCAKIIRLLSTLLKKDALGHGRRNISFPSNS